MTEPGSFLRVAGLQLDRLRRFADRLEAGEADAASARQAEGALRRFLLAAQETAPGRARGLVERLVADFAALADKNRQGAALIRSRADEIERELSREEPPAPGAEPAVAIGTATAPAVLLPLRGPIDRAVDVGRGGSLELARPVDWRCTGRATEIDGGLAAWLEGHLAHLVSNAVRHGVEPEIEREALGKAIPATVWISAEVGRGGLRVEVGDDGRGLDADGLARRASRPASARAGPGDLAIAAGGGLAELAREVRARGGRIALWSESGRGTRVRLRIPFRSARAAVLPAEAGGLVAFPAERVVWIRRHPADVEPVAVLAGRPTPPVQSLPRLLWGARSGEPAPTGPAVVVDSSQGLVALAVDAVGAPETVALHALDLAGSGVVAASFRAAGGRIGWFLDADALAGLASYAESKKRLAEEEADL